MAPTRRRLMIRYGHPGRGALRVCSAAYPPRSMFSRRLAVSGTGPPFTRTDNRWRTAYRLTPKETELARLPTAGHSVETAAETLAITIVTARVHLRNLFIKTGTDRQSELILLLSRLSA